LRTARELLSIVHLARLTGYELRPGVAAHTRLAFAIEKPPGISQVSLPGIASSTSLSQIAQIIPGLPSKTLVDVGVKVQSLPGPGEMPQIFETSEAIEAWGAWNDIKPRLTTEQILDEKTSRLLFAGIATNIKPGDAVLFGSKGKLIFSIVAGISLIAEQKTTEVWLGQTMECSGQMPEIEAQSQAPGSIANALALGNDKVCSGSDLESMAKILGFDIQDLFDNLSACAESPPMVLVLRTKARIFGHNAPGWNSLPYALRGEETVYSAYSMAGQGNVIVSSLSPAPYSSRADTWAEADLKKYLDWMTKEKEKANSQFASIYLDRSVYLDSVYLSISQDSHVVMRDGSNCQLFNIDSSNPTSISEVSITDFTISSKVTRLQLNDAGLSSLFKFRIRTTSVFAESEALPLAPSPMREAFPPDPPAMIELDGWVDGLCTGQRIIVSGELLENRGLKAAEEAKIDKVEHILKPGGCTRISFIKNLKNKYVRSTVSMNANVANSNHGETRSEVLGSGDATMAFQRFMLRQTPLTYIRTNAGEGILSTLAVRVNDLLWDEVPNFYGHGPTERIFTTRTDDNGKTTVVFGNGVTGARLPSGRENVFATYRQGIGSAGLVNQGQLSLLLTVPLGVKSVTNPMSAEDAADRESLEDARYNAPLKVMALDRIVSLKDYEDFAHAYVGVAKALATWTWDGEKRAIFVTVAGPEGRVVDPGSLRSAMRGAGDPLIPLTIEQYKRALFKIRAKVKVDGDEIREIVLSDVEERLREHFSFNSRRFGQAVTPGEVISIIQRTKGVVAVNLEALHRSDEEPKNQPPPLPLQAALPQGITAAELLTLDPGPVSLEACDEL
jgi:hypothetical protein